jgi:hypothetical protein
MGESDGERAMRKGLKIAGWGIEIPAGILVLWTAWNLRHSFASLLLISIPVAAGLAAAKWTMQTRKAVTIVAGGSVLLTTRLLLSFVTDQFGAFTWLLVYVLFSLSLIGGLVLVVGIAQALAAIGQTTRQVLTVVGLFLAALFSVGTLACVSSTAHGYMAWDFMLPTARLTIGGTSNTGYVNRYGGSNGTDLIVTRRASWRGETYWIVLPRNHRPSVKRCVDWTAPRFPVIAIGDVNPPCWYVIDEDPRPEPPDRNLVSGQNFVEFTGDDGKRVKAQW